MPGAGIEGCLLARFDGVVPPPWLLQWLDEGLAGVLLFAPNLSSPEQTRSVVRQLRSHNPHVLIAIDEEGGIVTRVEAATGSSYPGNAALGAVDDVTVTRAVAQSVVGTGTVHDRALAGPWYLGTRGASRASLLAAANVLAGEPAA